MGKFLKRSAQGAGVPHEKRTSNLETVVMPLPSKIVLSMNQHIGAPAAPAVKKGDQVYVGSVVGKAGGFVSADIHSGVSGTVDGIVTITAPNGAPQTCVVIIPDGEQKVWGAPLGAVMVVIPSTMPETPEWMSAETKPPALPITVPT